MDLIRVAVPSDRDAIASLCARAGTRSGEAPLTEYKMRALAGTVRGRAVVGLSGGDLVGLVQAAWHPSVTEDGSGHWALEVVVEPEAADSVPLLLTRAAAEMPQAEAKLVWVSDPILGTGLEAAGFHEVRRIERMSVPLPINVVAPIPAGIRLAPFEVGCDELAWIATNNRAFAGHPENGAVTLAEMQSRMALSWFSAADLLMTWRGERLAGFCWTKVHAGNVGEIYIIAVDPGIEVSGLGRTLLTAGARHLYRERSCNRLTLYTEADNFRARRLYESAGFTTDLINRQFGFPG
jgi:mycothiol synthase